MAQAKTSAPTSLYRNRRSFAKIPDVMDVPVDATAEPAADAAMLFHEPPAAPAASFPSAVPAAVPACVQARAPPRIS